MSSQNICFRDEIRKIFTLKLSLSRAVKYIQNAKYTAENEMYMQILMFTQRLHKYIKGMTLESNEHK